MIIHVNATDSSTGRNMHVHDCPIHRTALPPPGQACNWWEDHSHDWRTANRARAESDLMVAKLRQDRATVEAIIGASSVEALAERYAGLRIGTATTGVTASDRLLAETIWDKTAGELADMRARTDAALAAVRSMS